MLSTNRQAHLMPSVLDRLLDDAPRRDGGPAYVHTDLAGFKRAVARDLEVLLNSRRVAPGADIEAYPQARNSVLSFGIPDLSSLSLLSPDDRARLRDYIRRAIERHEPRLSQVRVSLEPPQGLERLLRFRVDAVLRVHPHRPPVSFDATLELSSQLCRLSERG
ncbi:MAG: type VI secretion system baseplate subunit TssE [Burkholderiales bacterium]